jgi:iron complex outermembrane receptor protein
MILRRVRAIVHVSMLIAPWPASAQTTIELPQITVTAPSPIVRRAPVSTPAPTAAPAPAPPVAEPPLLGALPIVTDQFATVTVVPTEEISRSGSATLGDLLFAKPGITGSSFAPGSASRPIVRGLDTYRVRIQENGIGIGDASDLGEDHGVPIDPLAQRQIEVLRGPATLRWGSQAIGGVVNADNNRIPTAIPQRGFSAEFNGAANSVDNGLEGSVLLDAGKGNFAVHADAYGRTASDYRIPSYPYLPPAEQTLPFNGRQPNSSVRSNGEAIGGSYFFTGGFVGAAIAQFNSLYRIPGVEASETNTRIDMSQTKVTSKGAFRPDAAAVDAVRFWLGATNYHHYELANENGFDGIQQTFINRSQEVRVETQLSPVDLGFAALTTAFGVQGAHQYLDAPGTEGGLFDPNTTRSVAGYVFSELKFNERQRMQIAGRIEQVDISGSVPDLFVNPTLPVARNPKFTPMSAAIGFLQDLPWDLVGSVTGQYVERAPRAPELFSRGVHEATETFDIGNPGLQIEIARSVEAGLRRAKGPFRFEATAYYTSYSGFIFRRLTGQTCDDDITSCSGAPFFGPGGELNQAVYSQRNARFRGGEFQFQWDLKPYQGGYFGIDGQYDIVRATFSDGSNVPRIPPQRLGAGVYFRSAEWFARVSLLHAFAQNAIASVGETPTAGYNLLRAELSHTRRLTRNDWGLREVTVGLVGNNLLNQDIRNAVSFTKDQVLMPGAGVRLYASVKY